jgi:hypothetical protein
MPASRMGGWKATARSEGCGKGIGCKCVLPMPAGRLYSALRFTGDKVVEGGKEEREEKGEDEEAESGRNLQILSSCRRKIVNVFRSSLHH